MREAKIAIRIRNFYNGVMPVSQTKSTITFLALVFLLSGCSGNETANVNSAAPNANQTANSESVVNAQDDIEEFGKIVKLSTPPVEVTYNEIHSKDGDPNKKRLVAILKFSAADADQIATNAEGYKTPAPADVDAEDWFPPELIAKSRETGDSSLKGVEYAATDFLLPPYASGRLIRINDTDFFVLELFSL